MSAPRLTGLVASSLLLLVSCTSTTQEWTRAGVSDQQREQDKMACLTEAARPGPGGTRELDNARYERCMTQRGYQRAPATK